MLQALPPPSPTGDGVSGSSKKEATLNPELGWEARGLAAAFTVSHGQVSATTCCPLTCEMGIIISTPPRR